MKDIYVKNIKKRYEIRHIKGVYFVYDLEKEILESKPYMSEEGAMVALYSRMVAEDDENKTDTNAEEDSIVAGQEKRNNIEYEKGNKSG